MEKCGFAISMPLSSGMAAYAGAGVQVGAMWAQTSYPNGQSCLEGPSRSKIRRSVRGALSELWELPGNRRTLDENYIKSELEVYIADKTYD